MLAGKSEWARAMDNQGFCDWMVRHRLTDKLAARFLWIDQKTVQRYREGSLIVPRAIALACQAIDPVQLWRLEPIDLYDNDWRASSYKGTAIVRASSENLARWHAATAFNVSVRRRSEDEATPVNPWPDPAKVRGAVTRPGPNMTVGGSPGIVVPVLGSTNEATRAPARDLVESDRRGPERVPQ